MRIPITKSYSYYVSLMKVLLPIGIILSVGVTIGWPYLLSVSKGELASIDLSHPEIRENRMVRPHYLSTDEKGQPFHVDAEWAKEQTENLSNLVSPEGSIIMTKGQTFNVKATSGQYDSEKKVLDLRGNVTLVSTDGYHAQTEKARITMDQKVIEGDNYIEGEGPTGEIMGKHGFRIENRPHGKKVITLKGPSRVVINQSSRKKHKAPNVP